jgi:WD40 repeat protein/MinD-like ATPase involved in chromosome partitioning or flagellar assembly
LRRLLIAGRRSGVGRTTVAVNLAAAAARAGTSVLLVDANSANAAVSAFNLDPNAGRFDDATLSGARWWRESRLNLDVATVPESTSLADFLHHLDREPLRSRYQWAIVDAPLGTNAIVADALLWVDRGESVAAKVVPLELAKVGANGQASVLLIMPARAKAQVELDVRAAFGPTVRVATMPFDPMVGRSLLIGQPVLIAHPDAPASVAIRALATQLGLTAGPAAPDWPSTEPTAPDHIVATQHDDRPPQSTAKIELPAPAFRATTDLSETMVDLFIPPVMPAEIMTRPPESDFIDLPKPPAEEPPSSIFCETETLTSPDLAPSELYAAESPPSVPPLGFQVEFDALADGSAWTAPVADIVEVPGAGFAVASNDEVEGPPVPPPLEVPVGETPDAAFDQSSMPFVAHGVELSAPKAAIHGPTCNEEESDKFWGPTEDEKQFAAGPVDGHTGDLAAVAFSPDGRQLLTASWDKTIRVWWAKDGTSITTLSGHTGVVSSLAFAPDGDTLVTGSWDKTVRLWDAITYSELRCLTGHTGVVMSVAASADGQSYASGGWDKSVRLWRRESDEGQVLDGHTRMVTGVSFSPDGRLLASGSWDKSIRIWDAATGEAVRTLEGHNGDVTGLVWLSVNRLVSIAQDHTAIVWDAINGEMIHTLKGHTGEVNAIAASPDGALIATAGWDKSVRLWDAVDGAAHMVLTGHTGVVSGLSFDPEGRRLASVGLDRALRIWDVTTNREISTFTIQSETAANPEVLLPDTNVEPYQPPTLYESDDIFSSDGGGDSSLPPPSGITPAAAPRPLHAKVPALRRGGTLHALAMAGGGGLVAAGAGDGLVLLWDSATGSEAGVLRGHTGTVAALAFAPGGRMLASGGDDCVIRLWDVASARERLCLTGHEAAITALAVNPDGNVLVSADVGGDIRIWDLALGNEIHSLNQPSGTLALAFAPDGEKLAAGSCDGTINVWNITTLEEITELHGHERSVNALAFTTDGRTLASGGPDGIVRFWDVARWKEWNNLDAHSDPITALTFSSDGKLLATASEDATARLWDCLSGQLIHELNGHSEAVVAAAFAPDNFTLCTASLDQTVRSWYTDSGEPHGMMCQAADSVTGDGAGIDFGIAEAEAASASTSRFRLAAGSSDGQVRLWDISDVKRIRDYPSAVLEGHDLDVNGLAFTADGSILASASGDMSVRLWKMRGRQLIAKLEGHTGDVAAVAFSPDGTTLATGSWDTLIRLWDVAARNPTGTLRGHMGAVTSLAFHPAGRLIASAGWDKNVLLWDMVSKKHYGSLQGHEKMVTAVTFAPDGKTVVTGGWDKTARLWNPDTSRCIRTLTGHRFAVSAVAVHPEGNTLATGSWDTTVKLWDWQSGTEIRTLYGHTESIRSAAYSPDGSLIATGSWDGTVRIWDSATGDELALIKLPGFKFHAVAFSDLRKKK